jgi:hypothetical protein
MMRRRVAWRSEKGISSVIVAVSLIALFGITMLSVDYGSTVTTRRHLITATDSTALDRARFELFRNPAFAGPGPISCPEAAWVSFLDRNLGTNNYQDQTCNIFPNGSTGTGYVVVDGRTTSQTRFGGLFGIGNTHPYSLSAAQYGFAISAKGLRPFAFCNLNSHVQEWLAATQPGSPGGVNVTAAEVASWYTANPSDDVHPLYTGSGSLMGAGFPDAGAVHRMYFSKQAGDGACGDDAGAGNWGWVDFNCTYEAESSGNYQCGNGNPDLGDWLNDPGYEGDVNVWQPNSALPPPADVDGNQVCAEPVGGDPFREVGPARGCLNGTDGMRMQGNAETSALDYLVNNQVLFHVPIFNHTEGSGNNVKYQIYGFLGVRLWKWAKCVGSACPAGHSGDGFFDLEFLSLLTDGKCCSPNPLPGAQKAVRICDVDHDAVASVDARCHT